MAGDVLRNKAARIERCVVRAREEYEKEPSRMLLTSFVRMLRSSIFFGLVRLRWTWGNI